MIARAENRYLFIHVMKAGGTSFTDVIESNFALENRYPAAIMQGQTNPLRKMEAYLNVPDIVREINALPEQYQIVCGHVPYAIKSLLNQKYITMTVLREPVSRTISYLKHCRRYHDEHMGLSLEDIYEDRWFHASFMANYQTKLFSMTAAEAVTESRYGHDAPIMPPRSELGNGDVQTPELMALRARGGGRFCMEAFAASTGVVSTNDQRFEVARQNLRDIDVVGVTDNYSGFLQQLVDRYGWQVGKVSHRHAGENDNISPELHSRIAQDNEMDRDLYLYAQSLAG